jgi:hypothetical protein
MAGGFVGAMGAAEPPPTVFIGYQPINAEANRTVVTFNVFVDHRMLRPTESVVLTGSMPQMGEFAENQSIPLQRHHRDPSLWFAT